MKLQFVLELEWNDNLEKKLQKAIVESKNLSRDVGISFCQTLITAIRLDPEDNLIVSSLKAARLDSEIDDSVKEKKED